MKERQGSDKMSVLNPANASSFIAGLSEYAENTKRIYDQITSNKTGAYMPTMRDNMVLHHRLEETLTEIIHSIKDNMVARFAVMLPYDEMQSMLMSDETRAILQAAGSSMGQQYTNYEYKLGEKVAIRISCRGGKLMPTILFPHHELTNFSEEFLDLVRPLYLITKSWMDVLLAFKTVCKLVQDTRELNFYVPWLRLVIPEQDLTNQYNAPYRVSNWLKLGSEKHGTVDMITRQVRYILMNEHTNRRTWMPSELVQMVRQGEELVTQYNIMKSVSAPHIYLSEDRVSVEVVITVKDHPTIKWASEAHSHRIMKEVERVRVADEKAREKNKW